LESVAVRIKYSKLGKIRFLGHRDVARVWERAFRRTNLPLEFTQGFSPHPRIAFGLALPVGWESTAEYLDARFTSEVASRELRERLESALPAGLSLIESGPVRGRSRSLADLTEVADYLVLVTESDVMGDIASPRPAEFEPELWSSVGDALSQGQLLARRVRRGEELVEDIRPMILKIEQFEGECGSVDTLTEVEQASRVLMRLRTKPYVLRPEIVLSALGGERSWHPLLVRRTAQYWQENGGLQSLDETIDTGESAR
jgi:radical SAM-linked protein